jgi:phage-related protein
MTASKRIRAAFYATASGKEPVRIWLKALSDQDRKTIGEDIAAVEFTWPVGMPLVGSLKQGLWEVRSTLSGNRIARTLFCASGDSMVLLHGFIKKTQKTPDADIALARRRQKEIAS